LNERSRRLFAASEAKAAGRGGILAVSEVTGVARSTIGRGLRGNMHNRDSLSAILSHRPYAARQEIAAANPTRRQICAFEKTV
jgi:hypothetical protein